MTERPRLSQLATELLAREPEPKLAPPSATKRAHALSLMTLEVRAVAARQRRRRALLVGASGLMAAAAVIIGVLAMRGPKSSSDRSAWARALHGDVHVVHDGASASADGHALVANDHIVTGNDGNAAVTLSTGTRVTLDAQSDLVLVEGDATQVFSLEKGRITLEVAKLVKGERFLVRTSDAEIEVRGTSFTVAMVPPDATCANGSPTRLAVQEGVVVIRVGGVETRVAAGERFPRDCGSASTAKATLTPSSLVPTATMTTSTTVAESPTVTNAASGASPKNALVPTTGASTAPSAVSLLTAQNDLFAQATAARQRGDAAGAIATYERFLAKYPESALAESATVERMRLLGAQSSERGKIAALAYLGRYPQGFARAEAEKLASVP